MLKDLHIENIAVIERCDISFDRGLNVLTGETGAGKSIIIDALNAVLGNRTSRELVRTGAEKAMVTAVFEQQSAMPWLESNDIGEMGELILQRKITADGKSSCRVNGVPVTASQLKELGTMLVDIHGQNDGLRLLDEKSHLGFLDSFAQNSDALGAYKQEYKKLLDIQKEIKALSLDDEEKSRLSDTLSFRIDELEKAELKSGEYDSLRSRRDMLRNSEKLSEALDEAINALASEEGGAITQAQSAVGFAERAARFAADLEGVSKQLGDAAFVLSDAYETLSDFRRSLDFSEEEYNELESRILLLEKLQRKYTRDEDGLIDYLSECREKLEAIQYSDERLIQLNREEMAQMKLCREKADVLSETRCAAGKMLEGRIVQELKELNMPSVRFRVDMKSAELSGSGADEVAFLMSANAGEDLGKISRIASGGELSRIMLALKNVFAEHDIVNTMIFDEVDAGVSGISAQRVAEKLFSVSKGRQVMCVTHLPQIAAMADEQYLVEKSERDGRTFTNVINLDDDGRKGEIARLYGGDIITGTTLAAASEQLSSAKEFKNNF